MKAEKKIHDFVPKTKETRAVMANIDEDLYLKAKEILAKDRIGWRELIEGAILKYLSEIKK